MVEQEHVQIVYSDSGLAKIRVVAGLMEDYSEDAELPRQVFRQGFRVSILDARGLETGYLKADKAVRRMSDQVWVLTGDVQVLQDGGNALYTSAMESSSGNIHLEPASTMPTLSFGNRNRAP